MTIIESTSPDQPRDGQLTIPPALTLSTAVTETRCTAPLLLPPPYLERCREAVRSILFETDARVLGVTSAAPTEAKASLAAGIATTLALDTREPTVLVECDPEQPIYRSLLGIPTEQGVVDWLREDSPLPLARMQALHHAFVIPVGGDGNDVGATFYQLTQTHLVHMLRRGFRNVVLDLPPVRDPGHSLLATHLADRILLTAVSDETLVPDLQQAVQFLDPVRVQGIVLTEFRSRIPRWLRRLL